ncbi:MAG TPA: 2-phospho-L-lactate guanylyltransferase [Candidatus Binatia bacterium]|nr:2-phospho-L-lactate guanylyltransferase [Candidatus Binatia bacterium]
MATRTWICVLVKEPAAAKTRLAAALSDADRARLAKDCALRVLTAARLTAPTLAVCGGPEAAWLAARAGVEALVEASPLGQNQAGHQGLEEVAARGGFACLLLSSDLPLVEADDLRSLMERAEAEEGPVAVAVPALGREGTNAIYLRPLGGFVLQFGDRSLPRFAAEAERRGRRFVVHDEPSLALDLDEPEDLVVLARLRGDG